jgi:molecular chaperone GrpE
MSSENNQEQEVQDEVKTQEEKPEKKVTKKKKTGRKSDKEIELLKQELGEQKDKYLRLYSEFENFRRRNAKERLELISTASAELMTDLLPVLDDFERAMKAIGDDESKKELKEGIELIFTKYRKTLENKGLSEIEIKPGDAFDSEYQEAVTAIPAPSEELKGKIVDVIEKGYKINDRVIRFARVVTGE